MPKFWSRCRMAAVVLTSCGLAACGGGGGDGGDAPPQALTGTVALEGTADVLVPARIAAQLQGGPAGAGTPACTLESGTLPAGMALGSDCVLGGTPTETGVFSPRVRLTVAGYSGSLQVDGRLAVLGPELGPPSSPTGTGYAAGTPIEPFDVVSVSYTAPFGAREGDVITYRVASGALPAGLALDPATGRVSGTATQAGPQTFAVGATLARNGGRYEMAPREVGLDILPAPVDLKAEGGWFSEFTDGVVTFAQRGLVRDNGTVWLVEGLLEPGNLGSAFGTRFRPGGFSTGTASPAGGTIGNFTLTDYSFAQPAARTVSGTYDAAGSRQMRLGGSDYVKPPASAFDYGAPPPALPGTLLVTARVNAFEDRQVVLNFGSDGAVRGLFDGTCSITGGHVPSTTRHFVELRVDAFCFTGGNGVLRGVAFRHSYLFEGTTVNQWLMPLVTSDGTGSVLMWSN